MKTPRLIRCSRFHPARGFTLVELLVVIAIIAILAAILLPVISNVKRGAKQTKCVSNLRQVAAAMNIYANENNGLYPAAYGDPTGNPVWTTWPIRIQSSLSTVMGGRGDAKDIMSCPDKPANAAASTATYGINSYMMAGYGGWYPPGAQWNYFRTRVPNPSRTILVGEMEPRNIEVVPSSDKKSLLGTQAYGPGFRHGGKDDTTVEKYALANMAFCDGHVESLSYSQLLLNPPDLASEPVATRSRWKWW